MPHAISAPASVFDEVAATYDAIESHNFTLQWMRRRVQNAAADTFALGSRLLEIGCGTGTDALFFARRGHPLVALEPAGEMLAAAREKIALAGFAKTVEFKQAGAEQIDDVIAHYGAASFDGIFSNFGALNCLADLQSFAAAAAALLRPDGKILLNLMPPICPWEIFYFLVKLKPREAFRRWRGRKGMRGLSVQLGNRRVQTFYHSRGFVAENFSPAFAIEKQFSLGLFVPPPYLHAATRYKKFFNVLLNCEERLAGWPLLRNCGDHSVVILRKRANNVSLSS
jgi:ubiquinone/menaquinone biosynthesis C-methylase UbiE